MLLELFLDSLGFLEIRWTTMSRMKIRFWWFSLAACSVLLVTSLVHLVEQQTGHPADESDSLDTTQWRTPAVEERTEGRFQAHKMLNKT